ncbi:MAG: hypothetical protein KJZ86_12750 [Caldilineaceae bacterium]|nr:hypothetical protein [Caldilineaceae bacterium]
MDAQARVLDQLAHVEATAKRIAAKYGLLFHLFRVIGKLSRRGRNRVAIEIGPPASS